MPSSHALKIFSAGALSSSIRHSPWIAINCNDGGHGFLLELKVLTENINLNMTIICFSQLIISSSTEISGPETTQTILNSKPLTPPRDYSAHSVSSTIIKHSEQHIGVCRHDTIQSNIFHRTDHSNPVETSDRTNTNLKGDLPAVM